MRTWIIGASLVALALAGCSKKVENPSESGRAIQTYDVAEDRSTAAVSEGRAPPAIGPSAAPGVAFDYKYQFQLPDGAIAAVQEAHASKCEQLGLSRCRITGLRYSVGDGEAVSAVLELRLAPDIARGYGKEATGAVVKAGGRLSDTEFTGEDTTLVTDNATTNRSDAQARIAEIEARLTQPGVKDNERAQLQGEMSQLRARVSDAKTSIATQQARLASTPMTFTYYGKGGISGFRGNPATEAARSFMASLVTMVTVVLQILAFTLPWLLLLALFVMLWRSPVGRAVKRWWQNPYRRRDVVEDEASPL